MELSKSKAWIVCELLLKQEYMKDVVGLSGPKFVGLEKDPTWGCSSQQQDVWIPTY